MPQTVKGIIQPKYGMETTFEDFVTRDLADLGYDNRARIFSHVRARMNERFDLPMTYPEWVQACYNCFTRNNVERVGKHDTTTFYAGDFHGRRVIWTFNRSNRCVMTVITEGMVWVEEGTGRKPKDKHFKGGKMYKTRRVWH